MKGNTAVIFSVLVLDNVDTLLLVQNLDWPLEL